MWLIDEAHASLGQDLRGGPGNASTEMLRGLAGEDRQSIRGLMNPWSSLTLIQIPLSPTPISQED